MEKPAATPAPQRSSAAGMLWICLTATLWSFVGVLGKICLAGGMSPLQCAFMRAAFGCAAFLVHLTLTGQLRIPLRHALIFMLFGAWGFGVYFSCCQYTIKLSGAAMDIILQYTAPFWVAIFSRCLFGEELSLPKLAAMSIAAAGTLCVCLSGGSIPGGISIPGIVSGLISGLCYATHYPFVHWWQQRYPSAVIMTWMLLGGTLTLAVISPLEMTFPLPVWGAAMAAGLLCTYLGYFCYGEALKRISLIKAVVTSQLEPVLSMLWVGLAFGECFNALGWTGSVLILSSVLLLALYRPAAAPSPARPRRHTSS